MGKGGLGISLVQEPKPSVPRDAGGQWAAPQPRGPDAEVPPRAPSPHTLVSLLDVRAGGTVVVWQRWGAGDGWRS